MGLKVSFPNHQPPPLCGPQKSSSLEWFSETEDERPNMAKDSPIAFIAQEIPKVWGTVREKYI